MSAHFHGPMNPLDLLMSMSFLRRRDDFGIDLALVRLELAGWHASVEHLLNLGVCAPLHLGQAVVEINTHRHGETEEDEADLASEVGLIRVNEVGHDLENHARDGGRGHDVNRVRLLSQQRTRRFAADRVSYCSESGLILLPFRVSCICITCEK